MRVFKAAPINGRKSQENVYYIKLEILSEYIDGGWNEEIRDVESFTTKTHYCYNWQLCDNDDERYEELEERLSVLREDGDISSVIYGDRNFIVFYDGDATNGNYGRYLIRENAYCKLYNGPIVEFENYEEWLPDLLIIMNDENIFPKQGAELLLQRQDISELIQKPWFGRLCSYSRIRELMSNPVIEDFLKYLDYIDLIPMDEEEAAMCGNYEDIVNLIKLPYIKDVLDLISEQKKQFIFTGAPGTGKTYAIEKFAETVNRTTEIKRNQYFVQFHPSYDYTDFVEGLRPIEKDGNMIFVRMDGIFKDFCRRAYKKRPQICMFVIDEINRADLSKVFGELMYCLEEGKRGERHRISTPYMNLPCYGMDGNPISDDDCFKEGFFIPENVIVVGTMNDIDRSVETFDFALRRRFHWIEVGSLADEDEYEKYVKVFLGGVPEFPEQDVIDIYGKIFRLNKVISGEKGEKCLLNSAYCIGPAYFAGYKKPEDIGVIWNTRIEPLLREYCRGQKESLVQDFIEECKNALEI